jgi:hypothetical protein
MLPNAPGSSTHAASETESNGESSPSERLMPTQFAARTGRPAHIGFVHPIQQEQLARASTLSLCEQQAVRRRREQWADLKHIL